LRWRGWLFLVGSSCCSACGDATVPEVELLADPGPRDAPFDAALAFDGVDDYASVGTARFPLIERAQTLALWVAPEPAAAGAGADDLQVLFTLRRSDYSGIVLALDHALPLAFNVWGRRELARSEAPLELGRWQHLAYVLDSAGSRLYVDGALVGEGPTPATNRTPILGFIASIDGYRNLFHGALDELRLYDRALTADEVAALARGERLDDADQLLLYLPFDELEGARSSDRSGLDNHAELGDGVLGSMPARIPSGTLQSNER
jgi:hypothetical protein